MRTRTCWHECTRLMRSSPPICEGRDRSEGRRSEPHLRASYLRNRPRRVPGGRGLLDISRARRGGLDERQFPFWPRLLGGAFSLRVKTGEKSWSLRFILDGRWEAWARSEH